MPGATMPSSTRATRSRYSSPAVSAKQTGTAAEQTASSTSQEKGSFNGWVEPQVQQKPSFQEAGLMRHGVVENMAPLGVLPKGALPKAGVFKKAAPLPPTPDTAAKEAAPAPTTAPTPKLPKIVLKPRPTQSPLPKPVIIPVAPAARLGDDTEDQEESENSNESSSDESEEDIRTPITSRRPSSRRRSSAAKEADEDYSPTKAVSRSGTAKSANMRRSVSRATPARPSSIAQLSPALQQTPGFDPSQNLDARKEAAGRVVEHAVDEALRHFRYPTAWALRTLYDENSGNTEFLTMIETIFTQTADLETVDHFSRLLRQKKKEGKKDNQARDYFVPPGTNSHATPAKAKFAPFGHLIRFRRSKLSRHSEQPPLYRELQWHLENPAAPKESSRDQQARKQDKKQEDIAASSLASAASLPPRAPQPAPAPVPVSASASTSVSATTEETAATPPPRKRQRTGVHESAKQSTKMTPSNGRKGNSTNDSPRGNGKAKLADSPSTRRRTRASSTCSSSSSLSSARSMTPPDDSDVGNQNPIEKGDSEPVSDDDAAPKVSSAAPAPVVQKGKNASALRATQPITRRNLPNAAKKTQDVVSHSSSSSTPAPPSPPNRTTRKSTTARSSLASTPKQPPPSTADGAAAFSMPAALESSTLGNLSSLPKTTKKASAATRQQKANQDSNKDATVFPSKFGGPPDDEKSRLRAKAKSVTNSATRPESYIRYEEHPDQQIINDLLPGHNPAANRDTPQSRSRPSRASAATPILNGASVARGTRSGQKRSHDEVDDQVSPTSLHFTPGAPDVASTAATSRAETPILRPAKKARSGLRVKNSPMKKKAGTSAGIPRASGERTSPAPNGFLAAQDENDDYCASCGGNGELLCCDGCTRSFHLTCVDPPLVDDQMPAEWFCNTCLSSRDPTWVNNRSGAFGTLLGRLDARNSSAFRLPVEVREYFVDVQTGADGEYEEVVVVPKTNRKRKAEEEQTPDFYRQRDNEGNPVLCHNCQEAARDDRVIIPCSVCGLFWHLDCVDPPLAVPPVLRTWKCPAHVGDLLEKVPGYLGPAHKFRKVKGAPVIEPAFSRGNVNNGFIEVVEESEDESGLKEYSSYGRIYRLSAKGIKLDFLSKARQERRNRKGKLIPPLPATAQPLAVHTLEEQQAARNLAQLSGQDGAGLQLLVDTLIAQASPEMISLMARANPEHFDAAGKLTTMDKQSLRAFLAHLETTGSLIKNFLDKPDNASAAIPQTGLPTATDANNHSRTATVGHPTTSSDDSAKELPSPPATDQPDERPVKTEGTPEVSLNVANIENGMDLE